MRPRKSDLRDTIKDLEARLELKGHQLESERQLHSADRMRFDQVLGALVLSAGYGNTIFVPRDTELPSFSVKGKHVHSLSGNPVDGFDVVLGLRDEPRYGSWQR